MATNTFNISPDVEQLLQAAVAAHLAAVEQFTGQYQHLKRWGYKSLAQSMHKESRVERDHWKELLKRLEFFDIAADYGHPQPDWPRHDIAGMIRADLAMEERAADIERRGIEAAYGATDPGSSEVFRSLLKGSEKAIARFEGWLKLYEDLTPANFKQLQT
jgi:bacterioferritin (cytochrome b1)